MKRLILSTILLHFISCQSTDKPKVNEVVRTPFYNADFEKLNVLIGQWEKIDDTIRLVESWSKPQDSVMNGISYQLNGKDTVFRENIRLVCRPSGIFYNPTVDHQNNGKEIEFKLKDTSSNQWVFENMNHDFPQRIIYKINSPDQLKASIEGYERGSFRRETFDFTKVVK